MATRKTTKVTKSNQTVEGSNSTGVIDVIKVYGNGNTVDARNGNDTITVYKGKKHKINGGFGKDTVTVRNVTSSTVHGGKGNDTIIIKGGSKNSIYGDTGKDTFVLTGTGKATIRDYKPGQDTVKVTGGTVTKAKVSGKNLVLSSGKGTLTLTGAADKTISLIDTRGSYTASGKAIKLGKNFNGTMNATKFLSTVKTINGKKVTRSLNITGNARDNVIYAGKAGGTYKGGAGNDRLIGGTGDDRLEGGKGNDTLTGGKGKDTFVYTAGYDTIKDFNPDEDTLLTPGQTISAETVDGNDVVLSVGSGTVRLVGAVGKYNLSGGGDDDDPADVTDPVDVTDPDKEEPVVLGEDFSGTFDAKDNESIKEINAGDTYWPVEIIGNAQDNIITGGMNNDTLDGGTGNDVLNGGAGYDTLTGGAGNDTLTGGAGNDTFVYGSGNDTITDYTNNTDETDILQIEGTAISNATANGSDVIVTTGNGSITLTGAADKSVKIEDAHGIYSVSNLATAPAVSLDYDFTGDSFDAGDLSFVKVIDAREIWNGAAITGNAQDNTIYAYKWGGTLDGGAGNDSLYGSEYGDVLNGGTGNDILYGNEGNDELYGDDGNDLLNGGADSDTLTGGAGNDTLTGGTGNDTFVYGSGNDTITDYTNNVDETDILQIEGTAISNATANGSDVIITTGNGNITLTGAADKSVKVEDAHGIYYVSNPATAPTVTLGSDFTGDSFDAGDLSFVKVIDAREMWNDAVITGNAQDNTIYAYKWGGTLDGGAGNDALYGSEYGDVLNGGTGNDILYGNEGNDELYGDDGNDVLNGGADSDTLTGGAGSDIFVYDSGYDVITDYTNNGNEADILRIQDTAISSILISGNDVRIITDDGTVTLTDAAGKSVKLEDSQGVYAISNLSADLTITLGNDFTGSSFSASDLSFAKVISAADMIRNITVTGNAKANILTGGAGSDTLTGGGGNDTFVYGSGNDTITDYTNNTEETDVLRIEGSTVSDATVNGNNVKLITENGSITLTGGADKSVKVEDAHGIYSVSNLATDPTVTLGGDFTGSSFDAGGLSFVKIIDAGNVTQAMTVTGNEKNNVIYAGQGGTVVRGGAGNDTLVTAGSYNDILAGGAGSDTYVVSNKLKSDTVLTIDQSSSLSGDTDTLQFKKNNKEDVHYSLQDNTLTILHSSGGTVSVTDWDSNRLKTLSFADGNVSSAEVNAYLANPSSMNITQQSVIKGFMRALDDTTMLMDDVEKAVDTAVKFASYDIFSSWSGLVESFISDIRSFAAVTSTKAKEFLRTYCGIDLDNDDTGAITGADAGGPVIKTAESIIPETGTMADAAAPTEATTINGLTFHWPDNIANGKEQAIVNAINKWWAKEGLDLIEESYGLSFTEEGTTVSSIDVEFYMPEESTSTLASVRYSYNGKGNTTKLTLEINMANLDKIDVKDVNGYAGESAGNLDRIIAHELTHAVMAANITGFNRLPDTIKEGAAELVHGIDDFRPSTIRAFVLTNNIDTIEPALSNMNYLHTYPNLCYAGGYTLLRYFAKQAADAFNESQSSSSVLTPDSLNDALYAFSAGSASDADSLSLMTGNETATALLATAHNSPNKSNINGETSLKFY